jgi:hypothetical protein
VLGRGEASGLQHGFQCGSVGLGGATSEVLNEVLPHVSSIFAEYVRRALESRCGKRFPPAHAAIVG